VHAFTLSYSRIIHNTCAFGLFISGIFAAGIFAAEERRQNGGKFTPEIRLRFALIAGSLLALAVMISGFFWNIAVSSVAEITMAALIFGCLTSYHREFRTRRVVLSILLP
jgi:hypothetical protein